MAKEKKEDKKEEKKEEKKGRQACSECYGAQGHYDHSWGYDEERSTNPVQKSKWVKCSHCGGSGWEPS